MHIAYIIKQQEKSQSYVCDLCGNMKNQLTEHNAGKCKTTSEYHPWEVDVVAYFRYEKKS
ncbi:MAG TPA: hypothetical protein PKA79_08195 [Oligoflexia bacterium]|nr:hypothetical protein [Oligoflexia bacterium]